LPYKLDLNINKCISTTDGSILGANDIAALALIKENATLNCGINSKLNE